MLTVFDAWILPLVRALVCLDAVFYQDMSYHPPQPIETFNGYGRRSWDRGYALRIHPDFEQCSRVSTYYVNPTRLPKDRHALKEEAPYVIARDNGCRLGSAASAKISHCTRG